MGYDPNEARDKSGEWTSGSGLPHGGGTHQRTGDKTSDAVLSSFNPERRFSKGSGYLGYKTVKEGGKTIGFVAKVEGPQVGILEGGGRAPATWSAFNTSGQRLGRGYPRADAAISGLKNK